MNSRTACIHHPDLRNTYIERVWTPRLRPGTKKLMNSPKDAKAARQRTYDAARRQRRLDNAAIVIERGIDKVLWASDAHQIEVEPNYRRLKLNYPRDALRVFSKRWEHPAVHRHCWISANAYLSNTRSDVARRLLA